MFSGFPATARYVCRRTRMEAMPAMTSIGASSIDITMNRAFWVTIAKTMIAIASSKAVLAMTR